jgi:hypothetical protein
MFTAEDVKNDISEEDRAKMMLSLEKDDYIPEYEKKYQRVIDLWVTACWLGNKLEAAGCPEEQVKDICFAHGQRCFFKNPYDAAAIGWNQYIVGNPEKAGMELSNKLIDEHVKVTDE